MTGQHVGTQSDSLVGDPALEVARSSQAALKRVMQPQDRNRGPRHDLGNGDQCPDGHGRMYASKDGPTQHCPHQGHDGVPHLVEPTRNTWPLPLPRN